MGLTSEEVHWIFGLVLMAAAMLLLLRSLGRLRGRWVDYLIPGLLALFGVELFIDPLVHGAAAPEGYAREMTQHFVLGTLLVTAAAAELMRVLRKGEGLMWRLPLAAALLLSAGVFVFHAQHDANVPMLLLLTQHRMIGATMFVAALAVLFGHTAGEDDKRSLAFPLLMLLLGAEFAIYTEGGSLFGSADPSVTHSGHSM